MARQINARIITRHDKEANWNKVTNFIPKLGEIIIYEADLEHNTPRIKIGNGVHTVKDLPFITDPYVTAIAGKKLSTNDYTNIDKAKVDAIPEKPEYTDTRYGAGENIGLDGYTFYNKGVVNIYQTEDDETSFYVVNRDGPGNEEKDFKTSKLTIRAIPTDEAKEEIIESALNAIGERIEDGSEEGCINVLIGFDEENQERTKSVKVGGWDSLGPLAFPEKTEAFEEALRSLPGTNEVFIGYTDEDMYVQPSPKLLYRADRKILYFLDTSEGQSYFKEAIPGQIVKAIESSPDKKGVLKVTGTAATYDIEINSNFSEQRNQLANIEPGYIVYYNNGVLQKTTEKLQNFEGVVVSELSEENNIQLAVCGRALVYVNTNQTFAYGDAVCADVNGLACKMEREEISQYPDRIVGIVSEILDDGRIWIRIK